MVVSMDFLRAIRRLVAVRLLSSMLSLTVGLVPPLRIARRSRYSGVTSLKSLTMMFHLFLSVF